MTDTARTLTDLLARTADVDDRGITLVDRRERDHLLSWGRLYERALATAAAMRELGVAPGDRVALVLPTGEAFFDAFFGAVAAGAVPVPLAPPLRLGAIDEHRARTARLIRAAGARWSVAEPAVRDQLATNPGGPAVRWWTPRELAEHATADASAPVAPAPDDLALVQFSSGTTLDPKPVALSHRALLAQVAILDRFLQDEEGFVHHGVSWLPLYHDMGLIGCVLPALARQADLALLPPELFVARPASWLRAISRHRATVSPAPDFAYRRAVETIRDEELEGVDLSSWRVALDGAETVSAGTLRAFVARFGRWGLRPEAPTPVYGLAEASLAVTVSPIGRTFVSRAFDRASLEPEGTAVAVAAHGKDARELVSLGPPVPGFEIEIRDRDLRPCPELRVGRVWIRGPSLMDGYLGRPEATARVLRAGWLDTGDLGFLDGGELFLSGRAKDLIIVHGRNYGPEEIERAAGAVPGVRAACAASAVAAAAENDNGHHGAGEREELVLFVEVKRRASAEEQAGLAPAVRKAVLASVGIAADRVVALAPGELPRTSSGKLRRAEAARRWSLDELVLHAGGTDDGDALAGASHEPGAAPRTAGEGSPR